MAALRGLAGGLLLAGALVLLQALAPQAADASGPVVDRVDLDGEINSVTSAYVRAQVSRAGADHAAALLIVMNTPGGQGRAMDEIVTELLGSPVPVVVYVSPPGARAASAGLFVGEAADILAMAPGTNIGSAHPISGSGADIRGDLGRKVLNDAVARVRDLAASHGRNADWAEQAVRQSVNVGAEEAVRIHAADLVAPTVPDLLARLDGRELARPHAAATTLHTAGARVSDEPMSLLQELLHQLTDPNIAYLLMLVGVYGLIAEISSPGAILPGTVGGIAAILALVALAGLPLHLAGVLLLGLAFLLFVADLQAPTHGILTVGGVISLVLGATLLIDTGTIGTPVDSRLVLGSAIVTLALFGFVLRKAVQARSRTELVGAASMVGALGEVRTPLDPEGDVFVAGRTCRARSLRPLARGEAVRVTAAEGGTLLVEAAYPSPPDRAAAAPRT